MSFLTELYKTDPTQLFKNKSIRKNIGNSFFYFGGSFIQFIVAIFTQPIYSIYLELEDFAIIGYFSAIQAILFPLFSLSLPFYYLAKYWRKDDGSSPQEMLSFILNFLNIANGIIAIISFLALSVYFNVFQITFPLVPFIFIVLANLFFEKFKTYFLIECRVQKKGLKFFLFHVLQIIVNTSFSLYFVIALKGGALGRMSGMMLGVIITSSIALTLFIREKKYIFSFNIDSNKIKTALRYCVPLIIGAYAYFPIGNIDRLFLERLGNTNEYGYYSIGLTIAGFAGTFFLALYQSFEPDLYKLITQKKYKKYVIFTLFYISIIAFLSILFIAFSELVVSFLTSGRYTYASKYANIFIVGIFFMRLGGFFEQLFTAFGVTKFVMLQNMLMGIFCVVTYYFMIQQYQFYGANITRVISAMFYLLSGAVIFILYNKKRKIGIN